MKSTRLPITQTPGAMRRACFSLLSFSMLALAFATPANAGTETVYEGTVGSRSVVFDLSDDGANVSAKYFYRATRLGIDLDGTRSGEQINLSSDSDDQITLAPSGADLTGSLTTAKGRTFPVRLHPAHAPTGLPEGIPPGLSVYKQLQLSGLGLTPGQAVSVSGKTLRWYREGTTGIRMFRLENGYPAPAMAAINHALARQQWDGVFDWFDCIQGGKPGMDVSRVHAPWLGPHVLSYTWFTRWCCEGGYPDSLTAGHSFDAMTGRELTLDEVLRVGHHPVPRPENSDAWYSYRSKTFAPAVVALLRRYHPTEMARTDGDCDYTDPSVWDSPSWALTAKGLWLGAIFPRAGGACDATAWAVIPWSALAIKP
jgi:hypothetical protein